jgi:hypothetical protein
VLRIGILQGGKIVHERLIKAGQSVTIGESEKNTFVFKAHQLPKRHTLFRSKGEQLALCFTDEMGGMIALPGGVVSLKEARANGAAELRGDSYVIPMNQKSRGKVVIGDITVLFQYVAAPPESARLVARQNFRPVLLEEDDPVFLGFLALWGALGAVLLIYALNSEKVDLVTAEEVREQFAEIAEWEDRQDKPVDETTDTDVDAEISEEAPPEDDPEQQTETTTEDEPKKPTTETEKKIDRADRRDAAAEATQQSALFTLAGPEGIGTAGAGNGAFVSGETTAGLRDSASSIDPNAGARTGFGEGADIARAEDGTTGSMSDSNTGGDAAAVATASTGGRTTTGGLAGSEGVEGEELDTSTQAIIKRVVKLRRSKIIDCYNKELARDPALKGRVIVSFDIEEGKPVEVDAETSMGSGIQSCIQSRVKSWRFDGVEEAWGIELTYNLQPS